MVLDRYLEDADLSAIHALATLAGMVMTVLMIQLSWHETVEINEPWIFRHLRRVELAGIAMALWWSFSYAGETGWQPWPPHVALTVGIDIWLAVSVGSAYWCNRAHKPDPKIAAASQ